MPLYPTTIAGSLPKPAWLAEPNKLWAPWRLEGEALAEGIADAVRLVVGDEVHVTVVHEIAHHFGIDDDRLHELGYD